MGKLGRIGNGGILLFCVLLMACRTMEPPREDHAEIIDVVPWGQMTIEEALQCAEQCACAFLLCTDGTCGFQPACDDAEPAEGDVVKVRWRPVRPPGGFGGPRRRWRQRSSGQGPVFVIPWRHAQRPRLLLPSQRVLHWERHHLFPQRQDLALWFKERVVSASMILRCPYHTTYTSVSTAERHEEAGGMRHGMRSRRSTPMPRSSRSIGISDGSCTNLS